MTKLPRDVSALECIKVLEKAGFRQRRQKGSHVIMVRDDPFAMTVVPVHKKKLRAGTLRDIIQQAGMTVDEFASLL
jgi:predicted RNA binding protein YcfA (HicA-like mRNA interferase family)